MREIVSEGAASLMHEHEVGSEEHSSPARSAVIAVARSSPCGSINMVEVLVEGSKNQVSSNKEYASSPETVLYI